MDIIHRNCAGLDVHKKIVVAAILVEGRSKDIRSFGTMTANLLELSDWLMSRGVVVDPFNWTLFWPSLGGGRDRQSSSEPPGELEL